jgi:2-amino-4-hydroxy-6-hydroxymethyldihydropteridine diphosphokinase
MSSPSPAGPLIVAIGLGSNLAPVPRSPFDLDPPSDPRARALEGALVLLRQRGHVLRAASPLYETRPEGVDEAAHAPFLNACVLVETQAEPVELLAHCEEIEREAGRRTKGDGAPRPLDLDLLAAWTEHGESLKPLEPLQTERLVLPHPRLAERGFVLVPLVGVLADAPLQLAGQPPATAWDLLRKAAKSAASGVKPGPRSASFPFRADNWEIAE